MAVERIVPDLTVASVARAQDFYGKVFGLTPVMDQGWISMLADPAQPELQLNLMTHDETAPVTPTVSVQVADLTAAHAAALAAGADIVYPITSEPWGVRRFFLRDPDGNVVNVLAHE